MSKKMKWLALLLCVLVAAGTVTGLVTAVQAANTDITSNMTFSYTVKDQQGNPLAIPVSGYQFRDESIFTVTIDWELDGNQQSLDTGDYFDLRFNFWGGINNIVMTNSTFNFNGVNGSGQTGVAGSATLGKVNGTSWSLKATFNSFLANLNNISGTFELQIQLRLPLDGLGQGWNINGTQIGGGHNPPPPIGGTDISWTDPRTRKTGYPIGAHAFLDAENVSGWYGNVNLRGMTKEAYFAQYFASGHSGIPPETIHIEDTLGPGQLLLPVFSVDGTAWRLPHAAPHASTFRYGGPGETEAWLIAASVDLRDLWDFFANPSNESFIESVISGDIDPSRYNISYDSSGVQMTYSMSSFLNAAIRNCGTTFYSAPIQTQIDSFCAAYLQDITPYVTNWQRTAAGFSFDLDVDAIDGRGLYMNYFSRVVNPAQLEGSPKVVANDLEISFDNIGRTSSAESQYWLTGGGNAVGDTNTLTIFKKDAEDGDLSGAVFTVERLGANPLTTGGAVNGVITLMTTRGAGWTYSATTGDLGSYTANEIYKITEITAPMGYIKYSQPVYLKIDPGNGYAVTLCDSAGTSIVPVAGGDPEPVGLCDNSAVITDTGKHLYITNRGGGEGEEILFTNEYIAVDFEFKKTDRSGTPLTGVEFQLYTCAASHTHDELVTTDGTSCWGGTPVRTAESVAGVVSFTQLLNGNYMMVETKTNAGLQLPLGQWLVHVDAAASPEITITAKGDTPPPAFVIDPDDGLLTVINYPHFTMPRAGSLTALLAASGGTALTGTSVVLVALRRKKRKGEDEVI